MVRVRAGEDTGPYAQYSRCSWRADEDIRPYVSTSREKEVKRKFHGKFFWLLFLKEKKLTRSGY